LKPKITILDLNFGNLSDTIAAFLVEVAGEVILVESGPHSTYPILKQAIENQGFKMEMIQKVFLTHIHFDHAGAAWAFAQHGATIYVHPAGEKHLANPTKLYHSAKMIYGDAMEMLWGKMESIPLENMHVTQHGETIPIGDGTTSMTAWHTPGHAAHHIVWQLGSEILFAGDVAGVSIEKQMAVPPCPPPDIDLAAWRASIHLIRALRVKKLYLTHYGMVSNPQTYLMAFEKTLNKWGNWMKPHVERGTPVEVVTPLFQEWVAMDLARHGITGDLAKRYELSNPAWMSVAGLMRYWKKQLKPV
jgi:glyoxylase-like metal-dependent hydrolase (beta-lactamase superfamily II)